MTRNSAIPMAPSLPAFLAGRTIVLVGLMGAGKTAIGRRLAARLGLTFRDADAEIEAAAGASIAELFERYGETSFREGERRVLRRLLAEDPVVLATGGGAFMDPGTRRAIREGAVAVWLRCPVPLLLRRVAGRGTRPLLAGEDPKAVLERLLSVRGPVYAESDLIVDCDDETPDATTARVLAALLAWRPPRRLVVQARSGPYDVVIGPGLLTRAGALLAPTLPQKRAIIVADATVAELYLSPLREALAATAIECAEIIVPPGEGSKSLQRYGEVVDRLLDLKVERRTAVLALGGGVVGDLAGFAAATTLRGLPFVQIPTTLLAQVDSSVGGKTGVDARQGKNLIGAFYPPRSVLADTDVLASLPERELRAGYAELVKAGLIGDATFFAWCEQNGSRVLAGDREAQAEAVLRAVAFKARVVAEDEREEAASDGRALLNLGHTFAHAFERETGYGAGLLHGEAVAIGIALAFRLSAKLGFTGASDVERAIHHLDDVGLPTGIAMLNRRIPAETLIEDMRHDKKVRDGVMTFVLTRGIGRAFTSSEVPEEAVRELLREEGCST